MFNFVRVDTIQPPPAPLHSFEAVMSFDTVDIARASTRGSKSNPYEGVRVSISTL